MKQEKLKMYYNIMYRYLHIITALDQSNLRI